MSTEQQYRDLLDTLTRDHVGGPDLAVAIASGRRRRRVRRTAVAGTGVAVVGLAAAVWVAFAPTHHTVIAEDPGFEGSPATDFVAGTAVDEGMQEAVARHLPDLAPAAEVYPSDWNTSGPIPDRDFADATEWHAVYDVSAAERLTVIMSQAIPGQGMATFSCADVEQVGLACTRTESADGAVNLRFGTVLGTSTYRFLTAHVAADGFLVETLDDVQAHSWAEAKAERITTDAETTALVQDAAMTFPAPEHTPAPPRS